MSSPVLLPVLLSAHSLQPRQPQSAADACAAAADCAPASAYAPPSAADCALCWLAWRSSLPPPGECIAQYVGFLLRGLRKDMWGACNHIKEYHGLELDLAVVREANLTWPTSDERSSPAAAERDRSTALRIEQCVRPLRAAMVALDALLVGCGVPLGPDEHERFVQSDDLLTFLTVAPPDWITGGGGELLEAIETDECDEEEDEGWEEAEEAAAAATYAAASQQPQPVLLRNPPQRPRVPTLGADRTPASIAQSAAEIGATILLGPLVRLECRMGDLFTAAALSPAQASPRVPELLARGIRAIRHVCSCDAAVGDAAMRLLGCDSPTPLRQAMTHLLLTSHAMRTACNAHGWWLR